MHKTSPGQQKYLVWTILLLLIPVIADEATRGMVAFEMQQSGELITPKINGEYYYNKLFLQEFSGCGRIKPSGWNS